jgi:nuclease-like protein
MTIHNRGGGQTGGTRSHAVGQSDSPAVPAASEPADDAVPWAWPGGEVTPAAEDPPEVEAPSFWDWEPAGDSSGLEDSAGSGDSPDSGGASDFGDVGDSWDSAEGAEDPWDLGRDAAAGPGGEAARGAAAGSGSEAAPRPRKVVVSPVGADADPPPREGIGRRVGNLAHLSSDPRMRAWQRRAIIAIIVGVVFSIVVSWQLGLTLAVLAAIADTIYRSRTVFNGPSGAKLTSAQRRTRNQLAKLERAGYHTLHCAQIPDSDDQIDHLVVGPAGVFAIDSEAWDKRLVVRTRNGRQLWHGPYSMKDRLEHARWESERAAELLSGVVGSPVSVRPAMAVYGPKIPWDVATIRDVDVFSGPRLRKYLRRRAREGDVRLLSESEAERIFKAAGVAFPNPDPG